MPAAYSLDLRQKVLAAIERGEKKSHVSRMFNISRNTLDLWLKRRHEMGTVAPIGDSRRGPVPKIDDLEAFRDFARAHGHLTQQQMADQWPGLISNRTIGKALQRIDFTRKKRPMAIENAMRANAKSF